MIPVKIRNKIKVLTKKQAEKLFLEGFKLSDQQFSGQGKFYINKKGDKTYHYWEASGKEVLEAIKPQFEQILNQILEND